MDLLRKVAAEQQTAIIVVTHDSKILDRLDQVFTLRGDWRFDLPQPDAGDRVSEQ